MLVWALSSDLLVLLIRRSSSQWRGVCRRSCLLKFGVLLRLMVLLVLKGDGGSTVDVLSAVCGGRVVTSSLCCLVHLKVWGSALSSMAVETRPGGCSSFPCAPHGLDSKVVRPFRARRGRFFS